MGSESVHHIEEAGVRRRWHPRDVASHNVERLTGDGARRRREAPNVHNSLAIQKKHVASTYRSAHGMSCLQLDREALADTSIASSIIRASYRRIAAPHTSFSGEGL